MRKLFLFLLLLSFSFIVKAQKRYFVLLKDKANSTFSINQPQNFLSAKSIARRVKQGIKITTRDLPVNSTYVSQINSTGASVIYRSKWMNGVLVSATDSQLVTIKSLSFVKSVFDNSAINGARLSSNQKVDKFTNEAVLANDYNYGASLTQIQMIGADSLHKAGYTGTNILIAFLDVGFLNADKLDVFKNLFAENRIVDKYDFVNNKTSVFDDNAHGDAVLSCVVGNLSGQLIGTAPDASVALYKTENNNSESKIEEINWLIAAERADSLGVDIITTSLGYTQFDNTAQSYTYQDLNGHTTISAKAANWAASAGILVFASMGNDGSKAWKYLSTPADADSVIAVGAATSTGTFAAFTSFGPNSSNQIKPELSAMGRSTLVASSTNTIITSSGTSFACPILAGYGAALMQQYPNLSAMKLRELMIKSGNQYSAPEPRLGYGIPNYAITNKVIKDYLATILAIDIENPTNKILAYPNPVHKLSDLNFKFEDKNFDTDFELFNSSGQKIGIFNKSSQTFLNSGAYFLKFINSDTKLKIIID